LAIPRLTIRISSPSAAAAFVLVDLLGERGVTASPLADGTWEVVLNLDGSGPETLSIVLSAARDWLRTCALPSTQVKVGAHTHSLAAESPAAPVVA
jgi:hypothetical protein